MRFTRNIFFTVLFVCFSLSVLAEESPLALAVINCDMIGEDLNLTGGTFNISCKPDSVPSYLNDVVVNFTKLADRIRLQSINGSSHRAQ